MASKICDGCGPATYRGRFAPSPSGALHLGSMLAAVASFLDARAHDGEWLVRIEDIDPPREQPGAASDILRTLERVGLHWDESVRYQSAQRERHLAAIDALRHAGEVYWCRCSRRDIRAAATAAGLPPGTYPGTCRERRLCAPGAQRLRTGPEPITVADRLQPTLTQVLDAEPGDFIVRRRDGLIAYQLAVVVDDADDGITDIVRGFDLWDNTPRQCWLQQRLGFDTPRYMHFPVLVDRAGVKLSKQTGAPPVVDSKPSDLLFSCLVLLRQKPPAALRTEPIEAVLRWGSEHWESDRLKGLSELSQDSVATQQNPLW